MSTKSGGIRSAFEKEYSSISNMDYLTDDTTSGSWSFHIYGASVAGTGKNTLGDNLYMDGIYMKEYKFSSYSKEIRINSDRGLFMLSALDNENYTASKNLIGAIDQNRADYVTGKPKECQKNLASFLSGLSLPGGTDNPVGGGSIGLGAVIVNEKGIAGFSMGGVGVYMLTDDGRNLIDIGCSEKNRTVDVGHSNIKISLDKPITEIPGSSTFLLCSPFIAEKFSTSSLAAEVNGFEPKDAVKRLTARAAMFADNHNVSCMIIKIVRRDRKSGERERERFSKRKKVIILIAAAAVVLLAAAGVALAIHQSNVPEDISGWSTVDQSRLNEDEKKIAALAAELKPYDDAFTSQIYDVLVGSKYESAYSAYSTELYYADEMIKEYTARIEVLKNSSYDEGKIPALETLENDINNMYPGQFAKVQQQKGNIDACLQALQKDREDEAAAERQKQVEQRSAASSSGSTGSSSGSSSKGGTSSNSSRTSSGSGSTNKSSVNGSGSRGGSSGSSQSGGGSNAGSGSASGGNSNGAAAPPLKEKSW